MATRKTGSAVSQTAVTNAPILEASYILRTASSGATSARYVAEMGAAGATLNFTFPALTLKPRAACRDVSRSR